MSLSTLYINALLWEITIALMHIYMTARDTIDICCRSVIGIKGLELESVIFFSDSDSYRHIQGEES